MGDHIGGFSYHGKLLFGGFLCGTSVHRFGPYRFGSSHAKSKAVTSMVVRKNNCLMQGDRAQSIHVKAFTSKVRPVCRSKLPGKKGFPWGTVGRHGAEFRWRGHLPRRARRQYRSELQQTNQENVLNQLLASKQLGGHTWRAPMQAPLEVTHGRPACLNWLKSKGLGPNEFSRMRCRL